MTSTFSHIVPLDRYNWELCLDIKLTVQQESFVPSVLYSLAQARFEQLVPFGVMYQERMVGFLMYGEFAGICWISRILIDKDFQRMGIGARAVQELIRLLQKNIRCKEIRTSYDIHNTQAKLFFYSLGFEPTEAPTGSEEIAVLFQS
ncbi:MAG: GNAT family N-acetyltransferase [Bacteroidota bacterium]